MSMSLIPATGGSVNFAGTGCASLMASVVPAYNAGTGRSVSGVSCSSDPITWGDVYVYTNNPSYTIKTVTESLDSGGAPVPMSFSLGPLWDISIDDAPQIAWSIALVWVSAWAIRMLRKSLNVGDTYDDLV